jgi:hypothetical protein
MVYDQQMLPSYASHYSVVFFMLLQCLWLYEEGELEYFRVVVNCLKKFNHLSKINLIYKMDVWFPIIALIPLY